MLIVNEGYLLEIIAKPLRSYPMSKSISYLITILLLGLCQHQVQGQSILLQQEQHRLSSVKDSISMINSLNRLGTLYITKNLDSSFYYSGKAKRMATRQHDKKGQTDADHVIARALSIRGLNKESLELYSRVLAGYRQQADTASLAPAMLNMAFVYMSLGDSTRAWALCRQAVQTGSRLKQDSTMSRVYAYYPLLMGLSADSTDYYLNKSREIAVRYKDTLMLIVNLQRQAAMLLDNKARRPELLRLIKESLAASRKAGLPSYELISLNYYAHYYRNDPAKALKIHQQVYKLIQEQDYQDSYYLKIILHFTELSGNKDEIIRIHGLLENAMDEDIANLKKFTGDYIKYNAMQDDNTQLVLTNKSNKKKIGLLIVICIVTVLVIIFMYRLYRMTRRLNRQITNQNTEMQKALTALEQSQADNTRMMQIVAHDLRNPIGAMYSIASMMLDEERTEEDRTMLGLIKTSGHNSLGLVSDLLKVHAGTDELKKEPVDLNQLLRYCVDLLRHKAEEKGQQIELYASAVTISANREKLWRVASNLIANAIKFSPTGAFIHVSLHEEADKVRIAVEDHGIGIPQEIAPKIFDMFTDAKRAGTAGEQPFGLGLAISKQIVEAHGGKLWFESKQGNGTTFFVELPVT
jgi:signal transduction histidine kinase